MKKIISVIMTVMMLFSAIPATAFAATETVPPENYIINDNEYMTRLRVNIHDEAEFELGFKVRVDGEDENRFNSVMGDNLLKKGKIRIDDGREWTFKEAGLQFATPNTRSSFSSTDKNFIKDFYQKDTFKITVITPEGYEIVAEKVKNTMDAAEREKFKQSLDSETGGSTETPTEPEKDANRIGNAKAMLVKSDNYNQESMSGSTMKHEAQMITDADGNITMVLHFEPATIMGILAYAKNFKLEDGTTDFIMKEDNSAVCFVKLPAFEGNEKVFKGHVYSSVMDAPVALKITKPKAMNSLKTELQKEIKSVEKMLKTEKFYDNTKKPVEEAIAAAKNTEDTLAAYTTLIKAVAGLRRIVENPFTGDTVFHMEAMDTSIVGSKSMEKYVKVEIVDNKKILTARYNSYLDWDGLIYIDSIKVIGKDGKEIKSEYKLDKHKNGILRFEMPYVPASGNFEIRLGNGNENEDSDRKYIDANLKLDYSTIAKGPFKPLLEEAVEKYGKYTDADWSTRVDMEQRKDDFTKSSWGTFEKALQKCREDINQLLITQEQIETDVQNLKDARRNLIYKIHAGQGKNANTGISGLNNPSEPYYSDFEAEYPEVVGWGGSRVVFGNNGEVYRVLDTGITEEGNNGKILLMSENQRVKKPFTADGNDTSVRWEKSLMRQYLNDTFYKTMFSDVEKKSILKSKIETYDYRDGYWGAPVKDPGTNVVTEDYIFTPDMQMMSNPAYGYGSKDSRIVSRDYALREVMKNVLDDHVILGVSAKGRIDGTYKLNSKNVESPVCMNIDSSKILMTVDAVTGIPGGLTSAKAIESNMWKFVMLDDNLKLNNEYDAVVKGNKVKVDLGKHNEKVMAVIVEGDSFNNGKIKFYGTVNSAEFTVPEFNASKDKLYIMAIHDEKGKTAYASKPAVVNVKQDIKPEVADKAVLIEKIKNAKAESEKTIYTEKSIKVLKEAILSAQNIADQKDATQKQVEDAIRKLDKAMKELEVKPLDYKKLEDGVYVVDGSLVKPDMSPSMADKGINHKVKLTVKDGKYYISLDFGGIKIGDKLGYLGTLKYYLSGYTTDKNGKPVGKLGDVTVESYQADAYGNRIKDEYGSNYPDIVTFELIPEALENGLVPMRIFVPVMEHIMPGNGEQSVFLKLDWKTIERSSSEQSQNPGDNHAVKPENKPSQQQNTAGAKVPKTGDETNLYIWILVMLGAGAVAVAMKRKKTK